MRLEQMRPDLAHAPLERAQMRALIASREQGLKFSKDVSAAARRVRLHPGENLLPLPGKRIFAGPSPVQDTPCFLLLLGKLTRFSSFLEDQALLRILRDQKAPARSAASVGRRRNDQLHSERWLAATVPLAGRAEAGQALSR